MATDATRLADLPDPLPVEPAPGPLTATVRPPGSKSLSCRSIVLAALADGPSRLRRPLRSEDTERLVTALSTLGATISWTNQESNDGSGEDLLIGGVGGRFPRGGTIDLGDGGTPTRFMIAAACLADEPVTVDGSARMRERPVAEGVELLRALGASIAYLEEEDRLPLRVEPTSRFVGGSVTVGATASSQFVSALLLVAPFLRDGLSLRYGGAVTSAAYVALTRDALRSFDVEVRDQAWLGPRIDRVEPTRVTGRDLLIEPDASSAVYWLMAAAMVPGSRVVVEGLAAGSRQPDVGVLPFLEQAGAEWTSTPDGLALFGPDRLRPIQGDASALPDGAVGLAVMAARADGRSRLTGLATLRVKESDRLEALRMELDRIGCRAEIDDASIRIDPRPAHDRPAIIRTHRDHRIAMAFGVLGLARPGLSIADPGCVAKSYPAFWRDLQRVR